MPKKHLQLLRQALLNKAGKHDKIFQIARLLHSVAGVFIALNIKKPAPPATLLFSRRDGRGSQALYCLITLNNCFFSPAVASTRYNPGAKPGPRMSIGSFCTKPFAGK